MLRFHFNQEIGVHKAKQWQQAEEMRRSYALDLSKLKDVVSVHTSAVMSMDFDAPESR
jgi:hypothetical protein